MRSPSADSFVLFLLLAAAPSLVCGRGPNLDDATGHSLRGSAALPLAQAAQSSAKVSFFAKDRVEVEHPPEPLKLIQKSEIPLRIHVSGITKLGSFQTGYHHRDVDQDSELVPDIIRDSDEDLPIRRHPDGSAYIEVVPLRLGQLKLSLIGRYPDGGIVNLSIMLEVGLPSIPPKGIVVGQLGVAGRNRTLDIAYLSPPGSKNFLPVGARYDDVHGYLPIDPQFVSFNVRTAKDAPSIEFHKTTGSFTPLRIGDALVVTTFRGFTNLTCVVVKEKLNSNELNHDPCASLLSPTERKMMYEEEMVAR